MLPALCILIATNDDIFVTLAAPTAPPTNINIISATASSLTLTWGDVTCGSRKSAIQSYKYSLQNVLTDEAEIHTGAINDKQVTIDGLKCNEPYAFKVAAVSEFGEGPWSDTFVAVTQLGGK